MFTEWSVGPITRIESYRSVEFAIALYSESPLQARSNRARRTNSVEIFFSRSRLFDDRENFFPRFPSAPAGPVIVPSHSRSKLGGLREFEEPGHRAPPRLSPGTQASIRKISFGVRSQFEFVSCSF